MEQKPIVSPYNAGKNKAVITEAVLNKIKEMTGAHSVFLVVSDEFQDHECTPLTCKGHYMDINGVGFSQGQIMGIISMMAEKAGLELVLKKNNG